VPPTVASPRYRASRLAGHGGTARGPASSASVGRGRSRCRCGSRAPVPEIAWCAQGRRDACRYRRARRPAADVENQGGRGFAARDIFIKWWTLVIRPPARGEPAICSPKTSDRRGATGSRASDLLPPPIMSRGTTSSFPPRRRDGRKHRQVGAGNDHRLVDRAGCPRQPLPPDAELFVVTPGQDDVARLLARHPERRHRSGGLSCQSSAVLRDC